MKHYRIRNISVLLALCALTLFSNSSQAANVGLIGLSDFDFGTGLSPAQQGIRGEQRVCVYSVPNGNYQITLLAPPNKDNTFQLSSGIQDLPFTVEWNGTMLKPSIPATFSGAATSVQKTNCENVRLKLIVNESSKIKLAGNYSNLIRFEIVKK